MGNPFAQLHRTLHGCVHRWAMTIILFQLGWLAKVEHDRVRSSHWSCTHFWEGQHWAKIVVPSIHFLLRDFSSLQLEKASSGRGTFFWISTPCWTSSSTMGIMFSYVSKIAFEWITDRIRNINLYGPPQINQPDDILFPSTYQETLIFRFTVYLAVNFLQAGTCSKHYSSHNTLVSSWCSTPLQTYDSLYNSCELFLAYFILFK